MEECAKNYVAGAKGRKGREAEVRSCSLSHRDMYSKSGNVKALFDSGRVVLGSITREHGVTHQEARQASVNAAYYF